MSRASRASVAVHGVGFWAATAVGAIGVAYAAVLAVGVREAGLDDPISDPVLAVMEVLTLVSAPLVVAVLAAVHGYAAPERKILSLMALAFGTLMAGLTSGVHFVGLTAGRQLGAGVLQWPSTAYALELLAWDVFLGLALLLAAPVFEGPGREAAARWSLRIAGALCLLGTVGPVTGDMSLQRIGIAGYGVGLPVAAFLVAAVFRHALVTASPEGDERDRVARMWDW